MRKSLRYTYVFLISFVLVLFGSISAKSQNLPLGYIEYFHHACNKTDLFSSLSVDDSASWMIVAEKPENVLRIQSKDSLRAVFPQSRAMFSQWIWGDFILRFDFRHVPSDTSKGSGFTLLAAARNADTYYAYTYTQDSLKFYYISDSTTKYINSQPLNALKRDWNTVIVQRDILSRSLIFNINNAPEKLSFSHRDLVMGYIGFGNHFGTTYLKNIKLWAPTVIDETPFSW